LPVRREFFNGLRNAAGCVIGLFGEHLWIGG
jgi:hypothetical protein